MLRNKEMIKWKKDMDDKTERLFSKDSDEEQLKLFLHYRFMDKVFKTVFTISIMFTITIIIAMILKYG